MMTNWAKSKPTQAELINAFANMSPANRAEVKNGLNAAIDNNSKVKLMGRRAARMDPAGNQALRVIEALDAIERYQARQ